MPESKFLSCEVKGVALLPEGSEFSLTVDTVEECTKYAGTVNAVQSVQMTFTTEFGNIRTFQPSAKIAAQIGMALGSWDEKDWIGSTVNLKVISYDKTDNDTNRRTGEKGVTWSLVSVELQTSEE